MGLRALASAFKTTFLGFTVLFVFQNCGTVLPDGGVVGRVQENPGNGGGYEGLRTGDSNASIGLAQTFVFGSACADGEPANVILLQGSEYFLTRENCRPVAPPLSLPSAAIARPSPPTLVYDGAVYEVR